MAAAYKVTLGVAYTRPEGVDSAIVWAHDSDSAIRAAYGRYPAAGAAAWAAATVTPLVEEAANLEGWVFTVSIADETPITVSYTAIADDDIDQVGAALVLLLNATAPIAGAAYNSGTNVLKIAETTDGLGDEAVTVTATKDFGEGSVASPEFFGTIVDEGMSNAVLSVVLVNAPSSSFGYGKA